MLSFALLTKSLNGHNHGSYKAPRAFPKYQICSNHTFKNSLTMGESSFAVIPKSKLNKYIDYSIKRFAGKTYNKNMSETMLTVLQDSDDFGTVWWPYEIMGFTFAKYCPEKQLLKVKLISANLTKNGYYRISTTKFSYAMKGPYAYDYFAFYLSQLNEVSVTFYPHLPKGSKNVTVKQAVKKAQEMISIAISSIQENGHKLPPMIIESISRIYYNALHHVAKGGEKSVIPCTSKQMTGAEKRRIGRRMPRWIHRRKVFPRWFKRFLQKKRGLKRTTAKTLKH